LTEGSWFGVVERRTVELDDRRIGAINRISPQNGCVLSCIAKGPLQNLERRGAHRYHSGRRICRKTSGRGRMHGTQSTAGRPRSRNIRAGMGHTYTVDADLPTSAEVKIVLRPRRAKPVLLSCHRSMMPPDHPISPLFDRTPWSERWPMTNLLDILKGSCVHFHGRPSRQIGAHRETLDGNVFACAATAALPGHGLGTNAGLETGWRSGGGGDGYAIHNTIQLGACRGRSAEASIAGVCSAISAASQGRGRSTGVCVRFASSSGRGTRTCFHEWHMRYGGRGVMIYWHVEGELGVYLLPS